ncbi:hypothetical protein [Chengkuizengella axinellae]|uniref:Uncharacterized protein n=1 Tax=Chengkuizengella axinellae TaxID=3064388 RepID=A0ABT9IXA3_9BACL|nr:hypothetical protein [Chengkuizengella sp. 2205SS18-9]MDP5274000.1 hypothetical protein [Chengkuizengella sp. 2205SS18-9]
MKIEGLGEVVDGQRTFIVFATDKELRLLTEKHNDYSKSLNIGDEINIHEKYEKVRELHQTANKVINHIDKLRNVIIDTDLVDVERGDSE